MFLTVVSLTGNLVKGWDGYGNWQEVVVPEITRQQIAELRCYVRNPLVTIPNKE